MKCNSKLGAKISNGFSLYEVQEDSVVGKIQGAALERGML